MLIIKHIIMTSEEKEIKKLKSIIKKLKKKKKKKAKRAASMEQKVTQKIIFQKGSQENNSRPYPQVLQQHIPSSDTEFLRSVIMQQNNNPLTRPVLSRNPPRPSYDLGDQYGLNLFQPSMQTTLGIESPQPIMEKMEQKEDDYLDYENMDHTLLQTPMQKQPYIPDEIENPPEINIKPKRTYNKSEAQIQKEMNTKQLKETMKQRLKAEKEFEKIRLKQQKEDEEEFRKYTKRMSKSEMKKRRQDTNYFESL